MPGSSDDIPSNGYMLGQNLIHNGLCKIYVFTVSLFPLLATLLPGVITLNNKDVHCIKSSKWMPMSIT